MNPAEIEGIYNYCDRWCERCGFTQRCGIYKQGDKLPMEDVDKKNRAFQERLSKNIDQANALLRNAAIDAGIDLEATQARIDDHIRRSTEIQMKLEQHPLTALSMEYSIIGSHWLKTQPGMLDRLENLKTQLTLGVETNDSAQRETHLIKESLATIHWYLDFIHDKLSRALSGKFSALEWKDSSDERQRDHNGSAKIAIIAIDRSIEAWSGIFSILPAEEDHFLKVLSMLERLKKLLMAEFPLASSFLRPGFDQ